MTTLTFRGTAQDFRANLAELLEYDKKYKWLECGMCHEMTPAERYVVGDQACISCANKELMEYEKHKHDYERGLYPASFISAQEQEVHDTMRQGDNYEDSNV